MDRVWALNALSTPPTLPGTLETGYPNDASGVATTIGAWWYYMVTEELRGAITSAGLTPDRNALNQLSLAIQQLARQSVSTGNAATATNVAYSGLTGTVPTWNQNTTGNAATATTVPWSGLTGTAPPISHFSNDAGYITSGNAVTATNVPYSGLTGTVPTWNQNTTGNAATSTTAVNLNGNTINTIPYQSAAGNTSYIGAPSTSNTFLGWNGSAYVWATPAGGGGGSTATTVPYSGLTGTVPTWNQNTTGTSANANNIVGGTAEQIPYQTGIGATSFIVAPTVANSYLEWTGSAFAWNANIVAHGTEVYTTNGSFTAPAGVYSVNVICCGGGGGSGGGGANGADSFFVGGEADSGWFYSGGDGGVGGGGGLAAVAHKTVSVTPGTSYVIAIGSGGYAGAAGGTGGAGSSTTFASTIVVATGGGFGTGGGGGVAATSTGPGAAGTPGVSGSIGYDTTGDYSTLDGLVIGGVCKGVGGVPGASGGGTGQAGGDGACIITW